MTVIVNHLPETGQPDRPEEWWMADVIFVGWRCSEPKRADPLLVADVDSGVVRWVNSDLLTYIIPRFSKKPVF